tara:strand:- start:1255 stop:1428 length:174 start_codon:yes stop_codon:yes gene_type:complete
MEVKENNMRQHQETIMFEKIRVKRMHRKKPSKHNDDWKRERNARRKFKINTQEQLYA